VLFVNGGILGLVSFHQFLREYLPRQSALDGEHILLTGDLTLPERAFRRLLCQRVWKDGWLGLRNIDLARFRHEVHAGLLARRRIASKMQAGVDVLHFHRQATAYGSLDLMERIPSIVTMDATQDCVMDDASTALERASYGLNARVDGAVFKRAAAIISTSRWAAGSLRRRYPDCTTPIHVLPDPVLLHHFDPQWIEMRRERARRGALPRLLFMGGDFPRKGGYDLLAAWRAGGFAGRATLEVVTNWDISGELPPGVRLTRGVAPHTAEWARRWAEADAFVMPTRNEAFGLVYQEAAAAGLPAIGTRHNAVPEIIRDGETGLLVEPGNVPALIATLDAIVQSAELRDRLGRHARQFIESSCDPERYLAELSGIILDAWRRRGTKEAGNE
jgi:starch synthase